MLGTFMQKGSHRFFNLHPNYRKSWTHNSLFFSECDMRFYIWWPQHLISFWESMSVQLDVGSSLFGSFKWTSLLSTSEKSCGLSLVQPHHNKRHLNWNWFATYGRQKYRTTVIHSNQNQAINKSNNVNIFPKSNQFEDRPIPITKKRIVFGTLWCGKELLANRHVDHCWFPERTWSAPATARSSSRTRSPLASCCILWYHDIPGSSLSETKSFHVISQIWYSQSSFRWQAKIQWPIKYTQIPGASGLLCLYNASSWLSRCVRLVSCRYMFLMWYKSCKRQSEGLFFVSHFTCNCCNWTI